MTFKRVLIWGLIFSVVFFVVFYFFIYTKVVDDPTVVLMLGNKDVSNIGDFFSKLSNVIISSLVLGFTLGVITGIGSGRRE